MQPCVPASLLRAGEDLQLLGGPFLPSPWPDPFPALRSQLPALNIYGYKAGVCCDLNLVIGLMMGRGGEVESKTRCFAGEKPLCHLQATGECYPLIGRSGPLQQVQKFRGNIGI